MKKKKKIINNNTASKTDIISAACRYQAPGESYDDFDSVMRKLELSAASLAEVAANKERNFVVPPAGQSVDIVVIFSVIKLFELVSVKYHCQLISNIFVSCTKSFRY